MAVKSRRQADSVYSTFAAILAWAFDCGLVTLNSCTHAEIATFTDHSLNDIATILDAHYLSRDPRMAESALKKREMHEAGTKTPNCGGGRRLASI